MLWWWEGCCWGMKEIVVVGGNFGVVRELWGCEGGGGAMRDIVGV